MNLFSKSGVVLELWSKIRNTKYKCIDKIVKFSLVVFIIKISQMTEIIRSMFNKRLKEKTFKWMTFEANLDVDKDVNMNFYDTTIWSRICQ